MCNYKAYAKMFVMPFLLAMFVAGCGNGEAPTAAPGGGGGSSTAPTVTPGTPGTDPRVTSSSPVDLATGVPTSTNGPNNVVTGTLVTATFSEAMDPATVISPALTFTLKETMAGTDVPGTVTMNPANTIATFTPTAVALLTNTNYTAKVTIAAKNAGGTAMANNFEWSFTTAGALVTSQAPVDLGAAGPFGVLAGVSITLAGSGTPNVIGDVGVSPGSTCNGCDAVTVPPPGTIYIGPAADSFKLALDAAYGDAQSRTTNVCTLASDDLSIGPPPGCNNSATLGTYFPGLFRSGTTLTINAGQTITLDGQGDPDAVFIFQSASAINTIGGNTHVTLQNGATAKNVYWVAESSATIGGTTSDFAGTVLALTSVTVNTGTAMEGRALARNGSVTVQDAALVTVPAP